MNILISRRSQELIDTYRKDPVRPQDESASLDLKELLFFLSEQAQTELSPQDAQLILMPLRAELLNDLCQILPGNMIKPKQSEEEQSKLKLILIALAGILVAACEGFDSMVTIMNIFALPTVPILACALTFAFLAIMARCSLDLIKLSGSLGIKFNDTRKLLNTYLKQFDVIKNIRKKITTYNLSKCSIEELKNYDQIIKALQESFARLAQTGKQFDEVLNSAQIKAIKLILSSVAGALFFGGSFCAGQTVSVFILSLFMTAITPASLPVLLFSVLAGIAAFSLYWYVEFPGVNKLVGRLFGFDREKIDLLCDQHVLDKEQKKLEQLQERITGVIELKEEYASYPSSHQQYNPPDALQPLASPQCKRSHSKPGFFINSPDALQPLASPQRKRSYSM